MLFQFTQDLGWWAYLLLAILVMVEGPVMTLAGAVAASNGLMKPVWVFASAAAANLISDTLWYTVGYLGKMEWLHRYGGWFGVREDFIHRLDRDIQKHAAKVLFVAKLTLGFSIPALIATGLARVPLRRWFIVLLVGETLWTGTLVVLGFFFGKYVQQLEQGLEVVTLVGALLFIAFIIFYLSKIRRRASESSSADSLEQRSVERRSVERSPEEQSPEERGSVERGSVERGSVEPVIDPALERPIEQDDHSNEG